MFAPAHNSVKGCRSPLRKKSRLWQSEISSFLSEQG